MTHSYDEDESHVKTIWSYREKNSAYALTLTTRIIQRSRKSEICMLPLQICQFEI